MTERTNRSRPSNRTIARIAGIVVLVLAFVFFVLQNERTVHVRFLFWQADTRLAWALILAGALGFLIGVFLPRLRRLF